MKKSGALINRSLVTFFALSAFVACSSSTENSSPIPDSINMEAVMSAQPLTDAQKEEIRSFKKSNLPDSSLYLYPQDQSQSAAYSRQQQAAALPADQKAIFDGIQSNCQFQMTPTTSVDDSSYSNGYNAGSQASMNYEMSTSGGSCPVLTDLSGSSSDSILASNFAAAQAAKSDRNLSIDAQISSSLVDNETVQSKALQGQTGILSTTMKSNMVRTVSYRNMGSPDGTMGMITNVSFMGTMNLVSGKQMTFVGTGQTLVHGGVKGGPNSKSQAYMKFIMNFPSSMPVIQIYLKNGTLSVYVNGVVMSAAEFKDLFGDGISLDPGGNAGTVNM